VRALWTANAMINACDLDDRETWQTAIQVIITETNEYDWVLLSLMCMCVFV
jgi:hypothetical protein